MDQLLVAWMKTCKRFNLSTEGNDDYLDRSIVELLRVVSSQTDKVSDFINHGKRWEHWTEDHEILHVASTQADNVLNCSLKKVLTTVFEKIWTSYLLHRRKLAIF